MTLSPRNHTGFALVLLTTAMVGTGNSGPTLALEQTKANYRLDWSGPIPTMYYCLVNFRELSAQALDSVMKAAGDPSTEPASPWFLLVHADPSGEQTHYVTLFYKPMRTLARVRRGKAVLVILDYLDGKPAVRVALRSNYAQVALSEEAENPLLQVPTPRSLPFDEPEGLSDDDIVALDKCGREGAIQNDAAELADLAPIGMKVQQDSSIRVSVGHGGGILVTCRRHGGGFMADEQVGHFFAP